MIAMQNRLRQKIAIEMRNHDYKKKPKHVENDLELDNGQRPEECRKAGLKSPLLL